jgi:uncharacterized protein YjdB
MSQNEVSVVVGRQVALSAAVQPPNATDQSLAWSSLNPSVATVSYGTVTGVALGETTVTATTSDGRFTAACHVTVQPLEPLALIKSLESLF